MAQQREVRGRGTERRSLSSILIEAHEIDGEPAVTVTRVFDSSEHTPESEHFALDEGGEFMNHVADCVQLNRSTGELFAGAEHGHPMVGEEYASEENED